MFFFSVHAVNAGFATSNYRFVRQSEANLECVVTCLNGFWPKIQESSLLTLTCC